LTFHIEKYFFLWTLAFLFRILINYLSHIVHSNLAKWTLLNLFHFLLSLGIIILCCFQAECLKFGMILVCYHCLNEDKSPILLHLILNVIIINSIIIIITITIITIITIIIKLFSTLFLIIFICIFRFQILDNNCTLILSYFRCIIYNFLFQNLIFLLFYP
jgi:hypothetical protein